MIPAAASFVLTVWETPVGLTFLPTVLLKASASPWWSNQVRRVMNPDSPAPSPSPGTIGSVMPLLPRVAAGVKLGLGTLPETMLVVLTISLQALVPVPVVGLV